MLECRCYVFTIIRCLQDSIVESVARQNYLSAIYDGSLYDVAAYRWPTHPSVANELNEVTVLA